MLVGVTGSSGWIGRYVTEKLAFPQRHLHRQQSHTEGRFPSVIGDLTRPETLSPFLKDLDALLHLAWNSHPRTQSATLLESLDHNLIASATLFEEFGRSCPGGHLVFVSTAGNMYADGQPFLPRTENDVPEPRSLYSAQKLGAESILRVLCHRYGFRATIVRISNPYGTLLSTARTQGLIGVALAKLQQGILLTLFESIESVRDYIHLSDVSTALEMVLSSPPELGECHLYHVSTGKGKTTREVLALIEALSGKTFMLEQTEDALRGKPSWSVISSNKLQNELGWKPTLTFEAGMEDLLNLHLVNLVRT